MGRLLAEVGPARPRADDEDAEAEGKRRRRRRVERDDGRDEGLEGKRQRQPGTAEEQQPAGRGRRAW